MEICAISWPEAFAIAVIAVCATAVIITLRLT
jgi:hypothetical protein